jgi:hypothetical protein
VDVEREDAGGEELGAGEALDVQIHNVQRRLMESTWQSSSNDIKPNY